MNPIFEHLTGFNALTDQIVAMDLLTSAKTGVRNYAMAITETGDPELKQTLTRHLEEAIDLHGQLTDYMVEKNWYEPWEIKKHMQLNLQNIQTALKLPTL